MKIFHEILADDTDAFKLVFGHNSCFDDVFLHVQFGISMKIFGLQFVCLFDLCQLCLFQDNRRTSTEMFGTATRVYSLQPFIVSMAID